MKNLLFLLRRLAVLLVLFFSTLMSFGQGPTDPIDPLCDPLDPLCPIDDYYGVMVFAVVLVAAYKAYKRRQSIVPGL